jgi:uncharacterized protein
MDVQDIVTDEPRIADRYGSLDLLRGIALLGVMLMNIPYMGNTFLAEWPPLPLDLTSPDWLVFLFARLTTEGAARGLFSLLFGAGVLLITSRNGSFARPMNTADVYFRRNLMLIALGLVNIGLLIWPGDILFFYGLSGLLLFSLRKLKPWILILLAVISIDLISTPGTLKAYDTQKKVAEATVAQKLKAQGKTLTDAQKKAIEFKTEFDKSLKPDPQALKEEARTRLSHKPETLIGWSFAKWMEFQGSGLSFYIGIGESAGFMLIGMALFKWKVLTAERPLSLYLALAVIGYGLGSGIRLWRLSIVIPENFSVIHWEGGLLYEPTRLCLSLGHIGLILSLYKLNLWGVAGKGFAALGRMALTNYLMQSAIALILFYGVGVYGLFQWADLWLIGLSIIFGQILFSLLWLKVFQFGPAEWLLRSVSYGRLQPMRKTATA